MMTPQAKMLSLVESLSQPLKEHFQSLLRSCPPTGAKELGKLPPSSQGADCSTPAFSWQMGFIADLLLCWASTLYLGCAGHIGGFRKLPDMVHALKNPSN